MSLFKNGTINFDTPASRDGKNILPFASYKLYFPQLQNIGNAPSTSTSNGGSAFSDAGNVRLSDVATPLNDNDIESQLSELENPFNSLQEDLLADEDEDDGTPLIVCPHCWKSFRQSRVMYISRHPDLVGDPVLGENARSRFLPEKFNAFGVPLDAYGLECSEMACPQCHLPIPEAIINNNGSIVSIVGAPSSGKSYYLTSLLHNLKKTMLDMGMSLSDADASSNMVINHYEQLLFNTANKKKCVSLPKTELQGSDFSSLVLLNNVHVELPLPFIFKIGNLLGDGSDMGNLIFYDNAGEHFEPGRNAVTNMATLHLLKSECLIFLFDPFKDSRILKLCSERDPQANRFQRDVNQVQIFTEMMTRLKMNRENVGNGKIKTPLYLVIPKYDAWRDSLSIHPEEWPIVSYNDNSGDCFLNVGLAKLVSWVMREWLMKYIPELVAISEGNFEEVWFLPASALGQMPEFDPDTNMLGVKTEKLNPIWVEMPMMLYFWHKYYVQGVELGQMDGEKDGVNLVTVNPNNGMMFLKVSGQRPIQIPSLYHGSLIYNERLGMVRLPKLDKNDNDSQGSSKDAENDFWNS